MRPPRRLLAAAIVAALPACTEEPGTALEPGGDKPIPGQIAYGSHSGPTNSLVRIVGADGDGDRPLLSPGVTFSPSWSPDGSAMAFLRPGPFGIVQLVRVEPQVGDETFVTSLHEGAQELEWGTPTTLVFSAIRPGSEVLVAHDVFVVGTDGSGPQPIFGRFARRISPTLSPDGAQVAFSLVDRLSGIATIWVADVTGTNERQLTAGPWDVSAEWSPDGSRIVFARGTDSLAQRNVMVMNADGTGITELLATPADEREPAWSPDGRWIAYVDARPGIAMVRADGSHAVALPDVGDEERNLTWRF